MYLKQLFKPFILCSLLVSLQAAAGTDEKKTYYYSIINNSDIGIICQYKDASKNISVPVKGQVTNNKIEVQTNVLSFQCTPDVDLKDYSSIENCSISLDLDKGNVSTKTSCSTTKKSYEEKKKYQMTIKYPSVTKTYQLNLKVNQNNKTLTATFEKIK